MSNAARAKAIAEKIEKDYGSKSGSVGSQEWPLDVIPTGSLSLDYSLGIGGWPVGHPIEIFGPPDIGKSSVIGLNAIANAQKQGKLCAIIAVEPGFDKEWAERHGVNTDEIAVARPDNGPDAFRILMDLIEAGADFILFDSIGALLRESEIESKKNDIGPAVGGRAGLISWGVHAALMKGWKNNCTVMYINQVRDVMNSQHTGVLDSPGGHALKHVSSIRIQLKRGKPDPSHMIKGSDGSPIEIAHRLKAVITRNKLSDGSRRTAEFDYYKADANGHTVGIDKPGDIIDVAVRTGIITSAGAWMKHPLFPGDKHHLNGKTKVAEFFAEKPEVADKIRSEVLEVMVKEFGPITNVNPSINLDNDGEEGE